jgi:hypothetical protein
MECVICYDKLKSHDNLDAGETNWTQKCITCKDSWVCGDCYHKWDTSDAPNKDTTTCYEEMPCPICKERMYYSSFVNRFFEGTGVGWWDYIKKGYENKPVWAILEKNQDS